MAYLTPGDLAAHSGLRAPTGFTPGPITVHQPQRWAPIICMSPVGLSYWPAPRGILSIIRQLHYLPLCRLDLSSEKLFPNMSRSFLC